MPQKFYSPEAAPADHQLFYTDSDLKLAPYAKSIEENKTKKKSQ